MNSRTRQIALHVLGCICFLALPIIFSPDFSLSFSFVQIRPFQREFLFYSFLLLFFYANYYVLIPNFFFRKKNLVYIGIIIIAYLLVSLVPEWILPFRAPLGAGPHPGPPGPGGPGGIIGGPQGPPPPFFENIFMREVRHTLFQFSAVFGLSLMLRINDRWKQTEKEKVEAELSYLRSQMNPHFLFNTLNSIYSLALDRSENTAPAMVKLSGIMRYVLSESDRHHVALEKEIAYISDYIDLQKIRLGDTVQIVFSVKGEVRGKEIAPMILIAFIENAFKHGVNPEDDAKIRVEVDVAGKNLSMKVVNKKVQHNNNSQSGLGIETTRKRLELLYPSRYKLKINDEKDTFTVSLNLEL